MTKTKGPNVTLRVLLAGLVLAASSLAVNAAAAEPQMVVELRVIEAEPGDAKGKPTIDPKLQAVAKDLAALPFRSFRVVDAQTATMAESGRISMEIPRGKDNKPRFLTVLGQGKSAQGKLRFQLGIEALKFDTLVSVPNGGTIIVGGPRGKDGKAMMFAFTVKQR
jgi:hypothetical protein